MKASELRIGNIVSYGDGELFVDINVFRDLEHYKLKPIPLTEEWLVKFGFEKEYSNYWSHKKSYFEIDKDNYGLWINSVNGNEYHHGNGFKHVHQLQNLYFALTGEELTLQH